MKQLFCLVFLMFLCFAGVAQASIYLSINDNEVLTSHPEVVTITSSYPYANPIYGITISTDYVDAYENMYSRVVYEDTNTNGTFALPSYALPFQYKTYNLSASYYNSMFNVTHYYNISFDYLDTGWISNESIPLYISIRNADPPHLDYTAHKIQREPLSLYIACNHDEHVFQYAGGTWHGGHRVFYLFNLTHGNWNNPESIDDMIYTWAQTDNIFRKTAFNIYNYVQLYDAVFFAIGTSYNNTVVTTDHTMDTDDWTYDNDSLIIERGHHFSRNYTGAVSYLEVFVRPWHLEIDGDGMFAYDTEHLTLLHTYGKSIGIENFAFIIGLIILAGFIIVPLGFSIRLDLDLPNFMYSLFAIAGTLVAVGFGLFPLWFLVSMVVIVLFLTLLSYKDIMMSAVDSLPAPFKHVHLKGKLPTPTVEQLRKLKIKFPHLTLEQLKEKLRREAPEREFPLPHERAVRMTKRPYKITEYSDAYKKKMAKEFEPRVADKGHAYWVPKRVLKDAKASGRWKK